MKKDKLYKKNNPLVFGFVKLVSKFLCKFVYNVKVVRNELKGSSGRRVLIANHESAMDFYPAFLVLPWQSHMVVSNSIMKSMKICSLMEKCGAIGKNQFQTSISDMRRMKSVIDHGELLLLYPAGLMPAGGASTPIPVATAEVLKWFGADIYVAKVSGTYMTKPKWSKVKRRGKITLDVYKLMSHEDYAELSECEAQRLIEEHLGFDAYRNSEKNKVYFKNGDNVEGLENVLYKCPKCKKEYCMSVKNKNTLVCSRCGYEAVSDNYGLLRCTDGSEAIYKYPSDWYKFIEESVLDEVKANRDFYMQTQADIYKINEKKHEYERAGEGSVGFNFDNFIIDGEIYGKEFHKEIHTASFPMLPFQPGERFEIQHGEDIFRIVPKDGRIVMKWIFTLGAVFNILHSEDNEQ